MGPAVPSVRDTRLGFLRRRGSRLMAPRSKSKIDPSDEVTAIEFLSSDDEEANEDLTLAIIDSTMRRRSRERVLMEARSKTSSSSSPVEEVIVEVRKKGKFKKPKRKKVSDGVVIVPEEMAVTGESLVMECIEVPNNIVLQKLLRSPRYFDPGAGENYLEACFNCGCEGHFAANCMMEKRQKPCFVCGLFGHNAKQCSQGQDCFICKKGGHIAKYCPEKRKMSFHQAKLCLMCVNTGHDMFECINDYPPDELEAIQCYICKQYGHFSCADISNVCAEEVSCYNCAQSGHSGLGCAKAHGEATSTVALPLCYRCGKEGHFARGCTETRKSTRLVSEDAAASSKRTAKQNRKSPGFRSVPRQFDCGHLRKRRIFEERKYPSPPKSRIKAGWIVDDDMDMSFKKFRARPGQESWGSPKLPAKHNSQNHHCDILSYYSGSYSSGMQNSKGSQSFNSSYGSHNHVMPRTGNSHIRFS